MSSNNVKKAIYDFLLSKTAITDLIGTKLFFAYNPNETLVYPYMVYKFIGGSLDRDSGTKWEKQIVSFTIYDNEASSARISDIADALDSVFDECEKSGFTITDLTVIAVDRITTKTNLTKSDLDNWSLSLDYEIEYQI